MNVVYTKRALKDLKTIPKSIQKRALSGIQSISKDPLFGKKLRGPLSKYYNLRVGEYRIIYLVSKKSAQVIIMTISPRGKAYKDLM